MTAGKEGINTCREKHKSSVARVCWQPANARGTENSRRDIETGFEFDVDRKSERASRGGRITKFGEKNIIFYYLNTHPHSHTHSPT